MRKKKLTELIISLILAQMATVFISFASLAAQKWTAETANGIRMGDLNITIDEKDIGDDGKEYEIEYDKMVTPGQIVNRIVRIGNTAEPAWIRVGLRYEALGTMLDLNDKLVHVANDKWVKRGNYWYCTEPFQTGESKVFVDEMRMPVEWNEADSGSKLKIYVTADAVQLVNFTPDFEAEDPWFGTLIEKCVHDEFMPQKKEDGPFTIELKGGSEGFIKTKDGFFQEWGHLMPGDTITGTIDLKSSYSRRVVIMFHTESTINDKLLKEIEFEIRYNNEPVFKGHMDESVAEMKLTELRKGDEGKLTFMAYVPKELNNAYALTEGQMKWFFSAAPIYTEDSGGGGGGQSGKGPYVNETVPATAETPANQANPEDDPSLQGLGGNYDPNKVLNANARRAVQTGDTFELTVWVVLLVLSFSAIVTMSVSAIVKRKKEAGHEE